MENIKNYLTFLVPRRQPNQKACRLDSC